VLSLQTLCFRAETRPADVYQVPDPGAGEGGPLQPVPDPEAADRDSARAVPDRTADKDLVPEPADETEETAAGRPASGDPATPPPTSTTTTRDHAPERRE